MPRTPLIDSSKIIPSNPFAKNGGTAWQLVAGTDAHERGEVETLEHLQSLLENSPEVAGPMLMGALVRLRAALQQILRDADAMRPVVIPAVDVVLLCHSVMRGLQ